MVLKRCIFIPRIQRRDVNILASFFFFSDNYDKELFTRLSSVCMINWSMIF